MSNYWKKKLDELNQSTSPSSTKATTKTSNYWQNKMDELEVEKKKKNDDIAPIVTAKKKDEERTWFQKNAFDDGYQFGDVTKTILGTVADTAENLGAGIVGMGERVVDSLAYVAPYLAQGQFYQNGGAYQSLDTQKAFNKAIDESKKGMTEFIKKDLYDEEKVAKKIIQSATGVDASTYNDYSVFGEKSDALLQSAGQLGATIGLQAVGVPWFVTSGVTAFGGEAENAFNEGASYEEAGLSAAISAGAEILTEKISGGIKFGGKALDDVLVKQIARGVSNKTVRTLSKLGLDAAGEGFEEVLSGVMGAVGQKITYADDKELNELFSSEEALESFIGGAVLGGGMGGISAIKSKKSGVDYASGLTANEQKVIDKVYADRVAEAEKNGKVTQKEKSKIYDEVLDEMEKGYISTDTIEEVLGGETFKNYQSVVEEEDSIRKVFDSLNQMKQGEMTGEQLDMRNEMKRQLEEIKNKDQRNLLKNQLGEEVFGLVKGDRLVESYNERSRRGQAFEADLTQYDTKQQAVIQKAVDSGILNNTRRTHEFVDMIAKISADKGVLFDFTNNEKLKESGFAVNGKTVNGYVTKDGVTLNIHSSKALNSVVGHEITHVLEGTEMYDVLQQTVIEYAKSKGDYQGRYDSLTELYKDIEGANVDAELTADLVGDYLFTDTDFINNLSTNNRNVFQKIYDEIKYLAKVATAGSKEARELEKVKRAFEKAYKAQKNTADDSGVKYSITEPFTDTNGTHYETAVLLDTDFFDGLSPRNWGKKLQTHVNERASTNPFILPIVDESGNTTLLQFAKPNERVKKDGGSEHKVLNELSSTSDNISKLAVVHIDEIVSVSEENNPYYTEENKHGWMDKNGWLHRNANVINQKNGNIYNLTIDIAKTEDGRTILYATDGKIKKVGNAEVNSLKIKGSRQDSNFGSSVAENGNSVKRQFSLSESVEETKDLIALHNLNTAELLETLKLSGLPSPSVAVIKAKDGHEKYGDVSLILPKETIDPQANKANRIYGSDAWTPTRSNAQVEYEVDYDTQRQFERTVEQLAKNVANGIFSKSSVLGMAGIEGSTSMNLTEVSKKISDYDAVRAAYVAETGGDVEVVYRTKEFDSYGNDALKGYIDKVGEQEVARLSAKMLTGERLTAEELETAKDSIVDNWTAKKAYALKQKPELREIRIAKFRENLNTIRVEDFVRHAWEFYEDSGATTEEINHAATSDNLRAAVNRSDVEAWVAGKLQGLLSEPAIYNGEDIFTPSGKRRSFMETHWEYTAENIVRAMNNADARGANMWNVSGEAVIATATPEYKNIDEVRADKERLSKVDDDHYEQIKDDISAELETVTRDIIRTTEHHSDNQFDEEQIVGRVVMEAAQGTRTLSGVKRVFQKNGYRISDAQAKSVLDLFDSASNVPTGYFEAKPQRVVGFDEVGVFVIPNNADAKLKQELLNRGYSIAEYDPTVEGDRQRVVNGFEEYKFSLSDSSEQIAPIGNYNVYGKDIALETAPNTESVLPNTETVLDNAETMLPDDIAPFDEDAYQDERLASLTDADAPPEREVPYYEGEVGNSKPIRTAQELREEKLTAIRTELSNDRELRKESFANYNQKISKLQAEYDAKKKKDTKTAQNILLRIERTKRLRDSTDADFAKRISDLETREKLAAEGKPTTRQELHNGIVDDVKSRFSENGLDFDDVLKNAKNLSTFSTVDNTPQRVMEKSLGYKEGQILSDITVNQVAQNETEGIKWLNSYTDRKSGVLAQLSKKYGIKPGSKESAAAQMYAEGFYVGENNDIIEYGDAELAKDFPDSKVQANIKGLAHDPVIRAIYDETLAMINESRTRNAYPEIQRLDNYFLHFRAMDDTFSRLGLPFNPNDIKAKDLPTDLNGVTADLKPGQPYFASAMHRTGKRTSFDLLGGLERYLSSAKNQIYHIDDIQTLRALRNYIADTYGQANGLNNLDTLSEEEQQERINEVFDSHLSTFAKFLNEEANILAGKTSLIDRGLEGVIGRRGITFLDTVNKQVGSNMVGYNISSSLTNFIPVAQTFAKTNKADFVKAFAQTVAHKISLRNDGFAENSPVMIRRKGADRFYRTAWQKAGDPGYALMGAVDDISTELIARTKYNELVRKGMDSQKAHYETDKWVSRLMGDRSLGQQPQIYNSKMLGLVTKFQLEVRNQLDSQFYDTIQEAKVSNEHIENGLARNAKTAAKVASTFVQLAVVQHLFGKAFESVAGYNPAFDIIEVLMTAFGFDDDEESEDTALDNLEQGFLALLEDLPYTSTLTGGRIPISAALPVSELIKGVDEWGNEKSRWETLGEIAPYYVLPGGYGQIKKTKQGLGMFSEEHPIAGSYTDSGNLRFPVEDTFGNRVQAGIFGQWASENARDYFDNERQPLKEKQIQEFIDVDMPIRDYWDYREGLKDQEELEDKFDYIAGLDLSVEQKNILINNVVDRKDKVDMSNYDDFDSFEEFDFYAKNKEKYEFLEANGVSYSEYKSSEDAKERYDSVWSWYNNYPEKVTVAKAVTDNMVEYRTYTSALNDIRADKDKNGKSISGTAKSKKVDYINSLNLDYGQRLILFKSEYNADDTYNEDIIEYLNNRDDLTYEDRVTILKELGFTVADGNVYW